MAVFPPLPKSPSDVAYSDVLDSQYGLSETLYDFAKGNAPESKVMEKIAELIDAKIEHALITKGLVHRNG